MNWAWFAVAVVGAVLATWGLVAIILEGVPRTNPRAKIPMPWLEPVLMAVFVLAAVAMIWVVQVTLSGVVAVVLTAAVVLSWGYVLGLMVKLMVDVRYIRRMFELESFDNKLDS